MSFSWENTLLALEGQGEKRDSLAHGGQLRFLKSKVKTTADLVSSPQYAGSNELDLFCVCVPSCECECVCKCVHRWVWQSRGQGKPMGPGLLPGDFIELQEASPQRPLEGQQSEMSPKQQSGFMTTPFPINTPLGPHSTGAGLSPPGPAEGEKGGAEGKEVARRASLNRRTEMSCLHSGLEKRDSP